VELLIVANVIVLRTHLRSISLVGIKLGDWVQLSVKRVTNLIGLEN